MASKVELNKKIQELEHYKKDYFELSRENVNVNVKFNRLKKCEKTAIVLLQTLVDENKIESKADVELIEFFLTQSQK